MNETKAEPDATEAVTAALPTEVPLPPEGYLEQLLAFLYTIAHWIGVFIVKMLNEFLTLQTPASLVDPIGLLALLTVFLIVTEIAKKLTWIVVVVGWILIIARIFLDVQS